MPTITTNASTFTDASNNGYIANSVVTATNNTTSVSINSNTQIAPYVAGVSAIGYSSQLFYNSLDTENILPIVASFTSGVDLSGNPSTNPNSNS